MSDKSRKSPELIEDETLDETSGGGLSFADPQSPPVSPVELQDSIMKKLPGKRTPPTIT
jgi:hypothetical protein